MKRSCTMLREASLTSAAWWSSSEALRKCSNWSRRVVIIVFLGVLTTSMGIATVAHCRLFQGAGCMIVFSAFAMAWRCGMIGTRG